MIAEIMAAAIMRLIARSFDLRLRGFLLETKLGAAPAVHCGPVVADVPMPVNAAGLPLR